MSLPQFKAPKLHTIRADVLSLSGQALLELMQAVLTRHIPFRFCARGWSMAPFIRDGDVITIAPFQRKIPRVGEVFAFIQPETGKLVVHRSVAKRNAAFLIQGDNVGEQSDGMVPIQNLLGRVIRIERNKVPIYLGLGLERYLIAGLSRTKLLIPIRGWLANCRTRFSRKGN